MIITEKAIDMIVGVMGKIGLDPSVYCLYFSQPKQRGDGFGFTFSRTDEIGKTYQFGGLKAIVDLGMDVSDLVIDVQEVDGTTGLIFKGETHVNHNHGKSR